jgi:hypothetical protein
MNSISLKSLSKIDDQNGNTFDDVFNSLKTSKVTNLRSFNFGTRFMNGNQKWCVNETILYFKFLQDAFGLFELSWEEKR